MYDQGMPALDPELFALPKPDKLGVELKATHKPRILPDDAPTSFISIQCQSVLPTVQIRQNR